MKNIRNKIIASSLIITGFIGLSFFSACNIGTSVSDTNGKVYLSVNSTERTVLPDSEDVEIDSYTVSGTGPTDTLDSTAQTSSSFVINDLEVGSWSFTVNGLNTDNTIVASGDVTVTVAADSTTSANVRLLPLSGSGDFSMSIEWASSDHTVENVTGTLTSYDTGTEIDISDSLSGTTSNFSKTGIDAGSYTLVLDFTDSNDKVAKAIFAVQIYDGMTSDLDVISDDLDNLYWATETAISINPDEVTNGTAGTTYSFTVTVTGLSSSISSVSLAWNFGDGSTGNTTLTNSGTSVSYTISHSYSSNSSYGLTVSASDGSDTIASGYATVVIGTTTVRDETDIDSLDSWYAANSGGYGLTVDTWDVSELSAGTLIDIKYDAYSIPDKFIIEYPVGTVVYNSGWRGDSSYDGYSAYPGGIEGAGANEVDGVFSVVSGAATFKVTIIGGASGTAWVYSMRARSN